MLETFLVDSMLHNYIAQFFFRNPGNSLLAALFYRAESMANPAFETVEAVYMSRTAASLDSMSRIMRRLDVMQVNDHDLHELMTHDTIEVEEMIAPSQTFVKFKTSLLMGLSRYIASLFDSMYKKYPSYEKVRSCSRIFIV